MIESGELSMIAKVPHVLTVRARTELKVEKYSHELFMRCRKEFPEIGIQVLRILESKLNSSVADLEEVHEFFEKAHKFGRS